VKTAYFDKRDEGKQVITFKTISSSKNYNEIVKTNYVGKIDYFVTFLPDNKTPLFIPIEKASNSSMKIYYGETPHSQQHWYKDFLQVSNMQ
jgi:hypothetical protein